MKADRDRIDGNHRQRWLRDPLAVVTSPASDGQQAVGMFGNFRAVGRFDPRQGNPRLNQVQVLSDYEQDGNRDARQVD